MQVASICEMSKPYNRTKYSDSSACLKTWQQCQRVLATNLSQIIFREAELHHAFSSICERYEGIVAAKKNLCGRDEASECRNSWSICSPGDVVNKDV